MKAALQAMVMFRELFGDEGDNRLNKLLQFVREIDRVAERRQQSWFKYGLQQIVSGNEDKLSPTFLKSFHHQADASLITS